ncbi:MAG: molybdopterin molybdotransferase MoeA [Ignisphaera sp.]|nr:molybdopterin molybdotransferase MoeA [Ignisphaera sp.]MCX8167893.1 molybdopterin molybdotransferase MoeA [Ignisphaera sp.]MDW8085466.1 molybdopterin molybdotransferase MoeA [Ignisphaera sp.]
MGKEFRYLRIDECLGNLVEKTNIVIGVTTVDTIDALGRIAYDEIVSPIDIPPYDRSAVDGYAVCSEATTSASPNNPIPLILRSRGDGISCGEAVPISTGDRVPLGADAVVMLEDTFVDNSKNVVLITRPVPKYANISRVGEDLKSGDVVVERGRLVRPWHIAAMAAIGLDRVRVYREVEIGVITIGSELRSGSVDVYSEGGVIDVTSKLVIGSLREYRFIKPRWYGIVEDDAKSIALVIQRAAAENDIVITSGGTGPSDRDLTFNALSLLGKERKVDVISRGIAMRPGRPTSIAVIDGKPLFMLSGYPVAAYISLRVLVLQFIVKLLGIRGAEPIEVPAVLSRRVVGSVGYDVIARMKAYRCGNDLCAEPMALHGSGVLRTLLDSNALLHIRQDLEGFDRGERVWIQIL